MGRELRCEALIGTRRLRVKAHLDATFVRLGGVALSRAGAMRLVVPFAEMRAVAAQDGVLRFRSKDGPIALELGVKEAERWAKDILHPKSRLEKLGVTRDSHVAAIGISDRAFFDELDAAVENPPARVARGRYDLIFCELCSEPELAQIAKLRARLAPAGALWLIYKKGKGAPLTERGVRDAFLAADLVDTKVVSFSETHTAVKIVIPASARPRTTKAPSALPRDKR
jgi:hypothetical protein